MTEEERLDKIDEYLQGRMSEDEKHAFEQELEIDAELKEFFYFVQDTHVATNSYMRGRLKTVLQNHEQTLTKNAPYLWLKVAASIVFLATVGYFILAQNDPDRLALYNQYYETYPNVVNPASRSSAGSSGIYQMYEKGQYEEVLKLLKVKTSTDTTTFYKAQSQLALEKYDSARVNFAKIDQSSIFSEPAQWYEALLFLKMKEDTLLQNKLQEIIARNGSYKKRAKELKNLLVD